MYSENSLLAIFNFSDFPEHIFIVSVDMTLK